MAWMCNADERHGCKGLLAAMCLAVAAAVLGGKVLGEEPTATTQPASNSAATTTQPATDDDMEPPREPSASDILKALSKEQQGGPRPVILPSRPGQTVRTTTVDPAVLPSNAIVPPSPRLFPDGYRVVDRPGRLTREGDYYTFSFESRSEGTPELPIRLLPNRLLEDMEVASAGGTKPLVFLISGELTEYHGVNYLLVQKLLTRPSLGNLK